MEKSWLDFLAERFFKSNLRFLIQADLRDTGGWVPDHCNKVNVEIKQVTQIFWFPSAYKY